MVNEVKQSNGSIVKSAFLAGILEIVIAYILMVLELGIMNAINNFAPLKDDIIVKALFISSSMAGFIGTIFIMKMLFRKVYKDNVGKITVCMLIVQVFVCIIMTISGYQYVDQTINLLKEEENLESVFYDEYAIKGLVWGYNYDEWKQEYIKWIDKQKDTFNSYSILAVACHTIGAAMGIVTTCAIFKRKSKNRKQMEVIQYESNNC